MSEITLKKRAEAVGILLKKKGILTAPIMRVGDWLDISGSMSRHISGGNLQLAFDQTMGVAVNFDDNGELDVFQFDTVSEEVGTATRNNYHSFVRDNRISARGGTAYSPIVKHAVDFYFGEKPAAKSGGMFGGLFGKKAAPASEPVNNMPVLALIHTDGEPGDGIGNIERALASAQNHPIYFHFIGVGGTRRDFPTIAKLADDLPNVGEVYLPRFDMPDDEVYDQVICDELVEWIGKFTNNATARA